MTRRAGRASTLHLSQHAGRHTITRKDIPITTERTARQFIRHPRPDRHALQTGALVLIAFAVMLLLLVKAKFLLISLATAIMVFSFTSDAINFIATRRIGPLRVPNWLASIAALILITLTLLGVTSLVLSQVNTVLSTALTYVESTPAAIASMFSWAGPDVEMAVLNSVQTLDVSSYLKSLAGQAGSLMQGTVLVILFVTFLFGERIWFSTKLTNFFGDPETAEQVGDIVTSIIYKVNYYLLIKTAVSAATGFLVYLMARGFGLDLAVALGIMAYILNFIPNIGSIVATLLVTLVTYVQFTDPALTVAVFLTVSGLQFFIGNVIDPILMGRALRLSTFGILLFLAFWGAVWGIPGMFLSVPIMVGTLIVCSHIPSLRPIAVLLSREGLPEPVPDRSLRTDEAA